MILGAFQPKPFQEYHEQYLIELAKLACFLQGNIQCTLEMGA